MKLTQEVLAFLATLRDPDGNLQVPLQSDFARLSAALQNRSPQFHLVTAQYESPDFQVQTYSCLDELLKALRQLVNSGNRTQVAVFVGERCAISKAPTRHLLIPDEKPISLVPESVEPDPSEWL